MQKILINLCFSLLIGFAPKVDATSFEERLHATFGNKPITVSDHDEQLKAIRVGNAHFFATHDGQYLFAGPVIDTQRQVDLVLEKEALARSDILNAQSETLFVRYSSSGVTKHQITVFTDIDCAYCRKLHGYMDEINERGISVNYAMVPRAGFESASYIKTLSALCSDNPAEAITRAMLGDDSVHQRCDPSQLNQTMSLARDLKINSTPTIVLPNGEIQLGLVSADQLANLLERGNQ